MSNWFSGGGGNGGMRSWQTSLDSLKNQVSSSLREVVDAVAVDPSTLNPNDDTTNINSEVDQIQAQAIFEGQHLSLIHISEPTRTY